MDIDLDLALRGLIGAARVLLLWSALFLVIEWVVPKLWARYGRDFRLQQDQRALKPELPLELGLALVNKLTYSVFFLAPVYALMQLWQPLLPNFVFQQPIGSLPLVAQVFVGMLVMDIAVYIEHRFVHRFFWPFHAIHHAAQEVSWATAMRMHPINVLSQMLIYSTVGWVLGFSGAGWVIAGSVNLAIANFIHTNLDLDWGSPLRYVIASPNWHKWHHERCVEAHDKNFALIFPFLDLLGGTFYYPSDRKPGDFGLYDRPGEEALEGGILEHVWYPFRRCYHVLRARLG